MTYEEIVGKVALELGLSKTLVDRTYKAYWRSIREHIVSLPLKTELTQEELDRLQPNVNIPSIGKLHVSYERYLKIRNFKHINREALIKYYDAKNKKD